MDHLEEGVLAWTVQKQLLLSWQLLDAMMGVGEGGELPDGVDSSRGGGRERKAPQELHGEEGMLPDVAEEEELVSCLALLMAVPAFCWLSDQEVSSC